MAIDITKPVPQHIAIIMDGNGRWATARGLPRVEGHRRGAEALKKTAREAAQVGVRFLTVFAFSSENWKRSKEEVDNLLRLMRFYLKRELNDMVKENVKFRVIGDYHAFPKDIVKLLDNTIEKTRNNTGLTLCMALNYGGRMDIMRAAQQFAQKCVEGECQPQDLTEEYFATMLYSHEIPDPDLFIRTSGELRVSNFLLWQLSYAEFVFVDIHWPDFDREYLHQAICEFQNRERRFGGHNIIELKSFVVKESERAPEGTRKIANE